MLQSIRNIGEFAREEKGIKPIDAMLTEINTSDIKTILIIDVLNNEIKTNTVEFYNSIIEDALFYQAGNGSKGGGLRLDYYKESKVKSACKFCEIEDRFEEIKKIIEKYIQEKSKYVFAIIKINGKTPKELFNEKFLEQMYSTIYNRLKGKHICHICGNTEEAFNTTTFKCYTNDKEVYGKVEEKKKSGFVICRECLDNILVGKKYTQNYLTSFWLGNKVMFLPHKYDYVTAAIYQESNINEEGEGTRFIDGIKNNEEDILELIGKGDSETDIVFYTNDGNKTFNIHHVIRSLLPSRFTFLSNILREYKLRLFVAIKYATALKVGIKDIETTPKERMRFIDAVFDGKNLDRNLFFKRAMKVYKMDYLQGKHKDNYCMYNINRIYNFLVKCGCLEGGWDVMSNYKDYKELFEKNQDYFNTNEKKAWFIMGKSYDLMNYYIKNKISNDNKDDNNSQNVDRTSLDKNFYFAKKFDFKDFVEFANLLSIKARKYNVDNGYFNGIICEAKELMANKEGKLSVDESKYLFFWGMDSYFEVEKKDKKDKK